MAASMAKQPGLGVLDASLIVVGSIVGSGIFLVSGVVAQGAPSRVAFLSMWVVGGVVALAGALSNGELGGMFPRSGGEYVYLREAYGPPVGFLSGWTSFCVGFPGSIAALAAGFGATVAPMLGLDGSAVRNIGLLAIVALTGLNALGLSPAKWIQNVLSVTKLVAFCGLMALALMRHAAPAVPAVAPTPPLNATADSGAVANALMAVFFAYSGWNAATYITGEMRDAQRTLGRALALGTSVCVVLYILVNGVYLHAMSLPALAAAKQPAREAAVALGGTVAAAVLSPLVAVSVLSSMQATVLVGPRIYEAMAADGLFFTAVGRVHATTRVPIVALLAQGAISALLLATGSFGELVTLASFAIGAFSTLTVLAVLVLRRRRPDDPRPFRVPGYPATPLLFAAVNVWVLGSILAGIPEEVRRALASHVNIWVLWSVLAFGTKAAIGCVVIVVTGIPAYAAFRAWGRPRAAEG
jgi:APA family basic amino acid/polyamine antiporter